MKKLWGALALALGLVAGTAMPGTAGPSNDYLLIPRVRAGPITRQTRESDLVARFGAHAVRSDNQFRFADEEPQGGMVVLFPDDPLRKIWVKWSDTAHRAAPELVVVAGQKSRWHTERGLTLGTTSAQLEVWNGRPFHLSGFDWDYGGNCEFSGGRLEKMANSVSLTMERDPKAHLSDAESRSLLGDVKLASNQPAARKARPFVDRIIVYISPK